MVVEQAAFMHVIDGAKNLNDNRSSRDFATRGLRVGRQILPTTEFGYHLNCIVNFDAIVNVTHSQDCIEKKGERETQYVWWTRSWQTR